MRKQERTTKTKERMSASQNEWFTRARSSYHRNDESSKNNQNDYSSATVLPHSNDTEIAVLGAMLLSAKAARDVTARLENSEWRKALDSDSDAADVFFDVRHQVIYRAIAQLTTCSAVADLLSVVEQLRKNHTLELAGGAGYLSEILRLAATYSNVYQHTLLLLEFYIKRSLVKLSTRIQRQSLDAGSDALELLSSTQHDLQVIARAIATSNELTGSNLSDEALRGLDKIHSGDVLHTGFVGLDELIGGISPGNYVLIGARPGVGKTAMALSMAINMMSVGKKVCFFSLEMNKMEIWIRLAAIFSGISLRELRSNPYIRQKREIQEFIQWLDNKFIFENSSLDELTVQSKVRHYREKYKIDTVFIDYIGLMQCSVRASTENERLERISRTIKLTAQDNEIPIIVLSQLNRDITKRTKAIPQMADLRGSGAMEQDADIIIFPHRPGFVSTDDLGNLVENLSDEAELIVEKHRHGAVGFLRNSVKFVRHLAKFQNISSGNSNDSFNSGRSSLNPAATVARQEQADIDF